VTWKEDGGLSGCAEDGEASVAKSRSSRNYTGDTRTSSSLSWTGLGASAGLRTSSALTGTRACSGRGRPDRGKATRLIQAHPAGPALLAEPGVAPLEASCSQRSKRRLNRGGDLETSLRPVNLT
jgi:hypothetical protein